MAIPQQKAKLIEPRLYPQHKAEAFLKDYPRIVEDHMFGNKR